jgi:hypothetical protein
MAIHGYPGGFKTTATPAVSTSSAKGIWTKISQLVYQAAGTWPVVPNNTVAPAVTGTAQVGSTLSCTTGTWTGAGVTGNNFDPSSASIGTNILTYSIGSGSCLSIDTIHISKCRYIIYLLDRMV